jgi:hypothetical protein
VARVELLVVEDCPNAEPARQVLRELLDSLGWTQLQILETVVKDERGAASRRFLGSPSIRVNDVDPFADGSELPGLSCRVYRTASGLRGTPDPDVLGSFLLSELGRS